MDGRESEIENKLVFLHLKMPEFASDYWRGDMYVHLV
jgi:hypothetical protein